MSQKFAYNESKKALNSRISTHLKYSNFNLHEWISQKFSISKGERIFDLGCGNGNFISLFWDRVKPEGYILGIDKNNSLIQEAQDKFTELPQDHVDFQVCDFDSLTISDQEKFNWVFSIYSLYYTVDSLKIIEKVKSLLIPGGTFVVVGPGPSNIKDLMEFSFELTGVKARKEFVDRIERIEKEFRPRFEKIFSQETVTYEEIDTVTKFPSAGEYAQYYWSTLLWRESIEHLSEKEIDEMKQKTLSKLKASNSLIIKKQMSYLAGINKL